MSKKTMTGSLLSEANNVQYLFLGGILGEILELKISGSYLKVNKEILASLGIEKENLHHRTFNSFKTAEDNGQSLLRHLKELKSVNNKKIVIIAHSKACLEVLLCLIQNFSESKNLIHKIILAHPPFRGSSLFKKQLNHIFGIFAFCVISICRKFMPGLECLAPDFYTSYFQESISQNTHLKKFFAENILVLRGHKNINKEVSWVIKRSHRTLQYQSVNNDGLLTSSDQILPFVNYQEIVLDCDHADLFTTKIMSTKTDDFKSNFMLGLINWSHSISSLSIQFKIDSEVSSDDILFELQQQNDFNSELAQVNLN